MDKNIIYLSNLFNTTFKSELNIDSLKDFLKRYIESEYLNDSFLFKNLDLSKIDLIKSEVCYDFDYKKYINFKILDKAPTFVFFNDNLILTENLNDSIYFDSFDFFDDNFIKNVSFFNDEFVLKNLNIFHVINTLFYKKLRYFCVSNNYLNNKPLYILNFFNDDYKSNFYFPRIFFKVKDNSNLNIFDYVNNMSKNSFVNYNTYLLLENNSKVNYFSLNDSDFNSLNSYSFYSKIYNNSFLSYNNHSFGSKFFKTNCYFFLFDFFSKVISNFVRVLKNKSKNDINSKMYHCGTNSFSRVFFKSVLSDFSSCDFNGLIDVNFDVLNSDGGLICKSLLLDELSNIKMVPELAIRNNELKCFHGATIGFLDENVIFYLMSRGFSIKECIAFLINAFLNDIINDSSLSNFNICDFLFNKYYKY